MTMRTSTPNKPIQVQIRLSEPEFQKVKTSAEEVGFNISQWIRYAIQQQIDSANNVTVTRLEQELEHLRRQILSELRPDKTAY